MDDSSSLLPQAARVDGENESDGTGDSESEVSSVNLSALALTSEGENLPTDVRPESQDGLMLLEGNTNLDGLHEVSDASSLGGDNVLSFEANSRTGTHLVDIVNSLSVVEPIPNTMTSETPSVGTYFSNREEIVDGASSSGRASRSIFEVSHVPLWGVTSVCGQRREMEDAVSVIPHFVDIPLQMLIDFPPEGLSSSVTHLTGSFLGVFDGHGGAEVSNYCKDRLHSALAEELQIITTNLSNEDARESPEQLWTRALTNCFLKVHDEVSRVPVARETGGSTAIVAIVCASHIIVANCGDSRAVVCRGREAVALSIDQKPDRPDEYERIVAAGGFIINWDGSRVSGILAMSRSIGDLHFAEVIPDPEVKVVPRTIDDECLILASDGLWDEMTNQDACDIARRTILFWYRNNTSPLPLQRGNDVDPASQAAAEALTQRALERGSGDNISVIVFDLKQRRPSRTVQ